MENENISNKVFCIDIDGTICTEDCKYEEAKPITKVIDKINKLYGFDNKKLHKFVAIKFKNTSALNKVKNLWYDRYPDASSHFGYTMRLKTVEFQGCELELYEAKLPPLLRYFHIQRISPSGWIQLPKRKYKVIN